MNRKLILSSIIIWVLITPFIISAIDVTTETEPERIASLDTIFSKIVGLVWYAFVALTIVMFMVAGILFLTAQGEPDKLETARRAALWGVVGVVVAIVGYSIIAILKEQMGAGAP